MNEQLKLFPDETTGYATILLEAAKIATERQEQYGEAVESVKLACKILDETFNIKLSVLQFCYVMVSLKLSRQKFKFKHDNLIDTINYLAIGIKSEENESKNA
jgi:hypothetical protein